MASDLMPPSAEHGSVQRLGIALERFTVDHTGAVMLIATNGERIPLPADRRLTGLRVDGDYLAEDGLVLRVKNPSRFKPQPGEPLIGPEMGKRDPNAIFRKLEYPEWACVLDALRAKKFDDEILQIALGCRDAAERDAIAQAWKTPAPNYTKRLAIIYHRRKDYPSEIAALERYLHFSVDAASHEDFRDRLDRAYAMYARTVTLHE